VVEGNFLVFFLAQDDPANQLLLLTGRTVLHGAPGGEKTIAVAQRPRREPLRHPELIAAATQRPGCRRSALRRRLTYT
jgi:hypothetical protein